MATVSNINQPATGNIMTGGAPANMTGQGVGANQQAVQVRPGTQGQGGFATQGMAQSQAPQQQSRFTNIRQYLEANKPGAQKLGQLTQQTVGAKAEQVGQAVQQQKDALQKQQQQLQQTFQAATAQPAQADQLSAPVVMGQQGSLSQIVNRAGQGLSDQEVGTFQKFLKGTLAQPFLSTDYTAGLEKGQQELGQLEQQTQSETGRRALLTKALNQPQYSTGEGTLDSLLLGTSGKALKDLRSKARQEKQEYGKDLQALTGEQATAKGSIGQQSQQAQTLAQESVLGQTGAVSKLQSALDERVAKQRQEALNKYEDLRLKLRRNDALTQDDINLLGGLQGETGREFQALYRTAADRTKQQLADKQAAEGTVALDTIREPTTQEEIEANRARLASASGIFDYSKYLGQAPDTSLINRETAATMSDYDRYRELMRLVDQQGNLLTQQGKADTGLKSALGTISLDYDRAINEARQKLITEPGNVSNEQYEDYVNTLPKLDPLFLASGASSQIAGFEGARQEAQRLIEQKNPLILSNPTIVASAIAKGAVTGAAKDVLKNMNSQELTAVRKELAKIDPGQIVGDAVEKFTGSSQLGDLGAGLVNPASLLLREFDNGIAAANNIVDGAGNVINRTVDAVGNVVETITRPFQQVFGGGGGGKVLCTELYRQGMLDKRTYELDQWFGMRMRIKHPDVFHGYQLWAKPVVKVMQRSPRFTRFVAPVIRAWAAHMAGKKNLLGAVLMGVGVPVCRVLGIIKRKLKR